ncbi:MAG: tetratricopeptide repeat protein [Bacteroidales bacterium]|nr:tetratricopeptide repeat protein [Bacteroidales bacterium]
MYNFRRFLRLLLFIVPVSLTSVSAQKSDPKSDTALISINLAKAADTRGDTAIRLYNAAIQTAEKCLRDDGSKAYKDAVKRKLIKARLGLGLVFYNRIEYSRALDLYKRALKEAEELGNIALEAESNFNIAEVYLEQSQFANAMEFYNLSLSGYQKVKDHVNQFWCYTGMGIVQKQCGNYRDAVEFYSKALQKAGSAGLNYEEAICYNNLGNVHRKTGDFAKAMESYQKAIEVFRKLNDETAISDCLNNIGNLYLDNGDPFRALEYYRQALKAAEQTNDEYRLIIRYKNLAGAYTELKDYENAGLYLKDALKLAEKSGDKSFLASCNMQFGKLHATKNDFIIASAFYRKSVNLYAEIGARHEQSEALVELANTLISQNQVKEAINNATEALEIAKATGSLKGRLDASICLGQCYEKAGNSDKAYFYLKSATALKDSIYTVEKYRTIEEIEAGFARSELKKENEALTQNSILQKQAIRTKNIILVLLGISLVMGIALIWLIYKRKNEAKREAGAIRQQSEEKIGQLSEDLIGKERELTSKTIFINQKNQLLERLIKELDELKQSEVSAQSIQHLQVQLRQELAPNAWKEFEIQFNEVHPGFQQRLLEKYPELTPAERRLCSFIRLDMNTREISSLSGQSIKSIEVARTRIRKKLGVPHDQNLTNYIALI